jgi:hypothetical protein
MLNNTGAIQGGRGGSGAARAPAWRTPARSRILLVFRDRRVVLPQGRKAGVDLDLNFASGRSVRALATRATN